ncbi:N-acetyl-beta-D-galactosaminidase [Aureococcus anophagefferens]|nr:N-acetyl-beta-D-galactosaminidase [Aureococcus anophagefferens]
MAAGEGADVEGLWAKALQLSEGGEVHEAILHFECASAELERQLAAAASVPNADRVRSLLGELLAKLGSEVELHLNYLRGNHWVALALEPPAGDDAVKKAYRRLALRYHPDKSRVSPKIFTIVGKAHEVLRHPERRKRYKPDKSATAWKVYRREHAAEFRAPTRTKQPWKPTPDGAAREYRASRGSASSPQKKPKAPAAPAPPLSVDRVRAMKVGELKERLKFFGVPATGERRDLEADLIRAAALKPRTPPSAAPSARNSASSPATRARASRASTRRRCGSSSSARAAPSRPGPRRARDGRRRRVRGARARRAVFPRSPDAKRAPDFAAPAKADRPSFDERPAASPEPAAPAPAEPKADAREPPRRRADPRDAPPRRAVAARTPRAAPPPEAPDPGLVDPGGGWFWG